MPETKEEEKVWVPFEQLETYLKSISATLLGIVGNIERSLDTMKEEVDNNKGENNDDN